MSKGSRSFGDMPIAGKLNIVIITAIAVILGVAGFMLTQWLSRQIEERSLDELRRTNQQVIDMIDAYATVLERSAEMLGGQFTASLPRHLALDGGRSAGGVPVLRGGEAVLNGNAALVDSFTAATGAVATVLVRQDDDFIRVATSLKKENGERAQGTPLGSQHPAIAGLLQGTPFTGRTSLFGRDYMTRYTPLKDDSGRVIGATFIGIDFTESLRVLKNKVLALKVGETGYVFALDAVKEPGLAVIHPAAEGKNLSGAKDHTGRLFVKEMVELKEGVIRYEWMNAERGDKVPREKITVVNRFDKWGWTVATGSYLDEFTRDVRGVRIQFAVTGLLVVAALVAVVFFSTRRWVAGPLGEVLGVTQRVAAGDLTVTVHAGGGDEVGRLLTATGDMCTHLRSMIGEVNEGIGTLASGVNKLAAASQQVADGSGKQSDAATAMAAAVEEMTASIDRVYQHAQEASTIAEGSGEVSTQGVAVIDSAVGGMASIADTVRAAASTVAQLGEQSERITSIVNVIREIADQTNLLALNAAIEAARAGEQGRGFAVVADEVRKLAERTTASTQEIAAMVGQIQSGAHNAVDSMNHGVQQVEEGVHLAGKAGQSIADIKSGAANVGNAVVGISDALREQTATSLDIAHNVERIAEQAERNHSQALQTSEAAADMEILAERLRQSIARFKT